LPKIMIRGMSAGNPLLIAFATPPWTPQATGMNLNSPLPTKARFGPAVQ
jgi:hypothetical protein